MRQLIPVPSAVGTAAGLGLTALLASAAPAQSRPDPVEELLRLHHQQRVAHVLGDAALLTMPHAPGFTSVNRGTIERPSREESRAMFQSYFSAVRFLEWEDVRPPVIRVSPSGDWAETVVSKRVRLIPADTVRAKSQYHTTFGWVARWERVDGRWQLATLASTDSSQGDRGLLAEQVRAYEILLRAREAVGGAAAVARIATMRFAAQCEGPGGPFQTTVASARDGRVRLEQRFPTAQGFAAGLALQGPWQRAGTGPVVDSLGSTLLAVLNGHEFHLLALAPESRFVAPVARPRERWGAREANVVRFRDHQGGNTDFLYDADTGLPLGFRTASQSSSGPATVSSAFEDWRPVGGVRLPHVIRITHGSDLWRYRIDEVSVAWLPDSTFRPMGS
jgi:hypothetical protein